jgi:beta-phosphoglucomutase
MLRGAIFDVDGVLVDSHPLHMRTWKRFLLSVGQSVKDQDMEFILEGRKRGEILRHFLGDLTEEQVRVYGRQKDRFYQEESRTIEAMPAVREFIEQLDSQSIPMAVASCGEATRVNHIVGALALGKYFQVVVTGDDVSEGKPDPAIFKLAARRLNLDADSVLVVEDSVSGVRAAKAAGMKCLGITVPFRAQELIEAGVDRVVSSFCDVSLDSVRGLFHERFVDMSCTSPCECQSVVERRHP